MAEGNKRQIQLKTSRFNEIDPVYANFVQIKIQANEIVITFGRVDLPDEIDDAVKDMPPIEVKPVARIILPHSQFPAFAELVAKQYNQFQRSFTTSTLDFAQSNEEPQA